MMFSYVATAIDMCVFHLRRRIRMYGVISILVVLSVVILFFVPTYSFSRNTYVVIPEGATSKDVALILSEHELIWSSNVFVILSRLFSYDNMIQSGTYFFETPTSLTGILYRVSHGVTGVAQKKVTLPEGYTIREMAEILSQDLPLFDTDAFLAYAPAREGYFFPDTYFFSIDSTTDTVIRRLQETYTKKIKAFEADILASSHSERDVLIMASILEKEGKHTEDRQMIADILWRRLADDYPLQVDATFGYIHGIDTFHPSFDDLEVDSPYNTYKYVGLPPTPINNPGEDALFAALHPTPNEYWYYLTDKEGTMHYAKTFDEHKENKARYLK